MLNDRIGHLSNILSKELAKMTKIHQKRQMELEQRIGLLGPDIISTYLLCIHEMMMNFFPLVHLYPIATAPQVLMISTHRH